MSEIYAEIAGPEETPYEGYSFRMKLVLSADFPLSPPRGFFLTRIYHPNVSTNGDICVNTLKRDWQSSTTIAHILQVIRCLLIVPFPESSLNDEAGKLFMDSYDEFKRRATIMAQVHAIPANSEGARRPGSATGSVSSSARAGSPSTLEGGELKSPSGRSKGADATPAEGKENDDENANAEQVNGCGKVGSLPSAGTATAAAITTGKVSAEKSTKARSRDKARAAKKKNLRRL
mmetsp:Transcript_26430/g.82409  ORF Transcript_26430/g.82409 Transcript_26430/m.82409 type:complete len:233 (+) Transcript_26430:663-1361(+)